MVYDHIGQIYYHWAKPELALKAFQTSLEIFEDVYGENDHRGLQLYNDLAIAYMALGNYDAALSIQKKTLKLQLLASNNMENMKVANRYYQIGSVYQFM
ncbi:MAG: tetratricopeptide repeat protein [Saprospiraceae bacterium]|nr:tetratricopeptide repeat protein [Saprospiraceae bacterium]